MEYEIGALVTVKLPQGEFAGKIFAKLPNYAWGNETKYEVHGHEFVTITSSRMIALLESLRVTRPV